MEFKAKKSLGQNFLTNTKIPEKMADAAQIGADDIVLEIGPGTGALTQELLKRTQKLIALEADPRAVEVLNERFEEEIASGSLVVIHADIREFNITDLGLSAHSYIVVANIPYYLSGYLFRFFLESDIQPKTIVFLVQKEVAERIARDKKESLLSLSVKVYGNPKYIMTVGRGNFSPQPAVDSAILAIHDIHKDNFDEILTEKVFFEILKLGFAGKRKQLLGSLSKKYPRDVVKSVLGAHGLQEMVRAEDISIAAWTALAHSLAGEKL